jgi:hypothetical protein
MMARILRVLWPAFFAAGALEMLVFAFVDPGELQTLGGERLGLSRQAVYTLSFFAFWAIVAAAGFTMQFLERSTDELNAAPLRRDR